MTSLLYREIRLLESLATSLEGPDALVRALQETVDAVTRWSSADRVTLIQLDRPAREIRHFLRGGPGWANVLATIGFDDLEAGLEGWALRTGNVALSPSGVPDPRESPEAQKRRQETQGGSILVAPIGQPENPFGTLTVINRLDQPDFTPDDANQLALFAQAIGWLIRWASERETAHRAQNATKAAIRSKTTFLSNLTHELRTPLNGILGLSRLLETAALATDQQVMVQAILQSGQRLLGTVDNLLELAQFETGQFQLETAPFSPRAVLETMVAKHRDEIEKKALELKVTTAADLPVVVEGDAVRIGQAWNQVLSNAVKFTERGSIAVRLEMKKTAQGRSVLALSVVDTGIGLDHEQSGQWFTPFHQGDGSLTRKFGGTGLGLALCDRIVRQMGGGISLMGTPGTGTKVRVWVDLNRQKAARKAGIRSLRILLQDPDQTSALGIVTLLEKAGHRVDYVDSRIGAQQRLSQGRYEVFITEPSSDAWEEGIQKSEPRVRLVGLYPLGAEPVGEGQGPWVATLMKPVTSVTLQAVLKRCLPGEEL